MSQQSSLSATWSGLTVLACVTSLLFLTGCTGTKEPAPPAARTAGNQDSQLPSGTAAPAADASAKIQAERAKLSPEDQRLVAEQEFCAVNTKGRLGSMGAPVKVSVKGQPVFLCCKSCQKEALADPDKTLARVEELKAKVKAGTPR